MPARSILSKHIPHLAAWSVLTAFLSYLGSRRRADGVRPKRAARLILQSRHIGRLVSRVLGVTRRTPHPIYGNTYELRLNIGRADTKPSEVPTKAVFRI
jgi:hypothetical protein